MAYTSGAIDGGISTKNRDLLRTLHQEASGPFTASQAAEFLGISLPRARRLVRYLADRGWLSRVRRGLYLAVPLEADKFQGRREDPWISATQAFGPAYLGGWSACEHWELTDQVFHEVLVFTSRRVKERQLRLQGIPIRLKTVAAWKFFGLTDVWRRDIRVPVSDPSRTIADLLNEPSTGGGIRHVAHVVRQYLESTHRDDAKLLDYLEHLRNRASFKRLGFILDQLGLSGDSLRESSRKRISTGISKLDPAGRPEGRILKRWNLLVNATLDEALSP